VSSGDDGREALRRSETVLVSACLLGFRCRYDGEGRPAEGAAAALAGKAVVPVCPEAGAGLGTPRRPVQLSGGDGAAVGEGAARAVEVEGGADRTEAFVRGAQLAVEAARRFGAGAAVLKERSPSCGCREVWCDGRRIRGAGVAAAALRRGGIPVLSEDEL